MEERAEEGEEAAIPAGGGQLRKGGEDVGVAVGDGVARMATGCGECSGRAMYNGRNRERRDMRRRRGEQAAMEIAPARAAGEVGAGTQRREGECRGRWAGWVSKRESGSRAMRRRRGAGDGRGEVS